MKCLNHTHSHINNAAAISGHKNDKHNDDDSIDLQESSPSNVAPAVASSLPPSTNSTLPVTISKVHVLDTTSITLTPDIYRSSYKYLHHLPMYTTVLFLEVDLHRYISPETKVAFKAEIEKHKRLRTQEKKKEKKMDLKIQEKEELERLQRFDRMSRIDPNDNFFHGDGARATVNDNPNVSFLSEDFGPAVAATSGTAAVNNALQPSSTTAAKVLFQQQNKKKTISYKATASGGYWPGLGEGAAGTSTKSCSSSSSPWGKKGTTKTTTISSDIKPTTSNGMEVLSSKRKGKKEKIVLFSTGGGRQRSGSGGPS